jgi:ferredoxin
MNGPFKAGTPDLKIFKEHGLKDKIAPGQKIIGDNGYVGTNGIVSTPNSHDPPEVRHFKSRARARHESFNCRIKNFKCLDAKFHHGIPKHKICFEAVCVICQYQLENGSPLFEI